MWGWAWGRLVVGVKRVRIAFERLTRRVNVRAIHTVLVRSVSVYLGTTVVRGTEGMVMRGIKPIPCGSGITQRGTSVDPIGTLEALCATNAIGNKSVANGKARISPCGVGVSDGKVVLCANFRIDCGNGAVCSYEVVRTRSLNRALESFYGHTTGSTPVIAVFKSRSNVGTSVCAKHGGAIGPRLIGCLCVGRPTGIGFSRSERRS